MTKEKAKSTAGKEEETRRFRMDDRLLYNVITRQAGTVEKAWLEAIQNSIDAEATQIEFQIDEDKFIVLDDGIGMNKEEILKDFEIFGATSKKENDLGEFGIGRGQVFAMGRVIWTTKNFALYVDIKKQGLTYKIAHKYNTIQGTRISVKYYERLKRVNNHINKLKEWIAYVNIPVVINDELANKKLNADYEDEDAYIKIDLARDKMQIYNRGIFVKQEHRGVGVIIVTKKNLKVNFARNDIIYDDPLWARISESVDRLLMNRLSGSQYLTQDNKKTVVELMTNSAEARNTLADKPVFKGGERYYSLNEIEQSGQYTVAFRGDSVLIDKVQDAGIVVLNSALPADFGKIMQESWSQVISKLGIREDSEIIEVDAATKFKLDEVQRFVDSVCKRKVRLGASSVNRAWTDGRNSIVLTKPLFDGENWRDNVWEPVMHEAAHDDNTEKTDVHGEDYDRHYRDLIEENTQLIAEFIRGAFAEPAE